MNEDLKMLMCESGVNPQGNPWVRLTTPDGIKAVMSPAEARDLALNLLCCAEAAETDAILLQIGNVRGDNRFGVTLVGAVREARADNQQPAAQS
jgi:hypothetical protein